MFRSASCGERLGGLPSPVEAEEIWRGIWLEEAHHSTAIEGNTLVLRQVEQLLEEGRAVGQQGAARVHGGAGLCRCRQLGLRAGDPGRRVVERRVGVVDGGAPRPSSRADTRLGRGAAPERDREGAPRLVPPARHRTVSRRDAPPAWPEVPALLGDWIGEVADAGRNETASDPEALARVHARFEQIHPFLDGNGRAGRLVLNLLLVRLGYPPAIIYKGERSRYLAALQSADRDDPGPLGELSPAPILDNLHKFVVPAVAGPSRLVPLPALAFDRISANALRVAATRGRLKASKAADGTWRSTRALGGRIPRQRYEREPPG